MKESLYVNEALTRKFAWKEMLERGFYVPCQHFLDHQDAQSKLGRRLLAAELPEAYVACALPADGLFNKIQRYHPFLWERLPGMLAFGYTQGSLIHGLRLGPGNSSNQVALTAAIFNMGIALFDYVVDELPTGSELFTLVNSDWLAELLDVSKGVPLDGLADRVRSTGLVEEFLLRSIVAFTERCKHLYRMHVDGLAWQRFQTLLFQLYKAELMTSTACQAPTLTHDDWVEVLSCKSAGPSKIIALLSILVSPPEFIKQDEPILDICDNLGRIFWLSDDLSDIAKDIRVGMPNYVSLRTANRDIPPEGRIREGITGTAEDLCGLLRQLEDRLASLAAPVALREDVLSFGKMSVYSWLTA